VCGARYNRPVVPDTRRPLADDTPASVEQEQVRLWQAMTAAQKAGLSSALCRRTNALAIAGITLRHPHDSPRQQFLRLAIVRLGYDLAVRAYPEAADLAP